MPPPKQPEKYPWKFHRDAFWNGYRWEYFTSEIEYCPPPETAPLYMGLSDSTNSHKPPRGDRKPNSKGLTTYSKRCIKSAVTLLFRDHGRKNLSFFTGTLPPMKAADEVTANRQFFEIVRQFNQMVVRALKKAGVNPLYVGVIEVQEKRFERREELALHYHALFPGRLPGGSWAISKSDVCEFWQRAVHNATGTVYGYGSATRIERPKRNLKQELGKYMSKGNAIVEKVKQAGRGDELPAQWWSMRQDLSRQVKAEVVELTNEDADHFLRHLDNIQTMGAATLRPFPLEWTNEKTGTVHETIVGYTGWWTSLNSFKQFLGGVPSRKSKTKLIATPEKRLSG
jgi:hypothetical protein